MDAMAESHIRFTEKLTKIAARRGLTKAQLASECEVSPQAMQRYFEGSAPRAYTALRLAGALDVDPVWLFNEDEPWRDNFPENPAASISHEALMLEAATRYATAERQLVQVIERAESIEWMRIGEQLIQLESGQERSDALNAALDVAKGLFFIVRNTIDQFDSVRLADYEHKKTRGYARWLPEADNPRRQTFLARIDVIYNKLSVSDEARTLFMSELQGNIWISHDPDVAFELVEDALQRYKDADDS